MSRVFTTRFPFNEKLYDAFITMIVKEGKLSFTIKVNHLDLQTLIPEGEIRYEGRDGFKKLDLMENEIAQSLLHSISTAIEDHLATIAVAETVA